MNNSQLFSGKAEDYFSSRPSYPEKLVRWLYLRTGAGRVVDIGAGTGIFTRMLLKYFSSVTAVEPNADMRKMFLQNLPDISCLDSCAENTGLESASIDLVTCAQAFHWFDEEKFKAECRRILAPGGKLAIVWNNSVKSSFTTERDEVCKEFCPRFARGYAGKRSPAEGDEFLRKYYLKDVEVESFENPFVMDEKTFVANMSSRSYAPSRGSAEHHEFIGMLLDIFRRYAVNGKVTEMLSAQVYLGRFQ